MTTIRVGDEIVCIDDSILPEQYLGIKAGEVYKCRWIGPVRTYLGGDYIGVRLVGINRGVCPQFLEEDPPVCCPPLSAGGEADIKEGACA
jgi:hypothetical protein